VALDALGRKGRLLAAVVPGTPEGVALFAALSSLPVPLVLLAPDPRAWPRAMAPPAGTLLVLPPSLAGLECDARALGYIPRTLAETGRSPRGSTLAPLQGPGVVLFTSGSTGPPRPVFRTTEALVSGAAARLDALGLGPGEGLIAGVSLAHGHGLTRLVSAMLLGGPFALLGPIDHRAALTTLAMPEFACWSATAHFADVLGRCALRGPARVPRICLLSSPISRAVFDAFLQRFGVPLRQNYSSSETGCVAVDASAAADVRPGTVGRPLAGVEVQIGDRGSPATSGEPGRIWVRSPWQMAGYGFSPLVERPDEVDGWWPTRDVGLLDADGRLTLAGRLDDCIRTREGRLVNLALVTSGLLELGGVRSAVALKLDGLSGPSFGAVVECDASISLATLRARISDALPPWWWPRKLVLVAALPRLPNGKPDRQACLAALGTGT
jgi:acyl-CoA synthetase (AMP-forming)/AMP-acid ligase II